MFLIKAQAEFMEAIGCNKPSLFKKIWRAHKNFMSPESKSKAGDIFLSALTVIVIAEIAYGVPSLIISAVKHVN